MMQQIFAELEAAGLIARTEELRNDRPTFVPTPKGRDAAGTPEQADDRAIIAALVRRNMNRVEAEVRNGVALVLNEATGQEDGWWWGSDSDALIWGPFESLELALADARRGAEDFKLVTWTLANDWAGDDDLPATRHVIVVDTDGKLIVKTGERPVAARRR
jgi:hypothetical protein